MMPIPKEITFVRPNAPFALHYQASVEPKEKLVTSGLFCVYGLPTKVYFQEKRSTNDTLKEDLVQEIVDSYASKRLPWMKELNGLTPFNYLYSDTEFEPFQCFSINHYVCVKFTNEATPIAVRVSPLDADQLPDILPYVTNQSDVLKKRGLQECNSHLNILNVNGIYLQLDPRVVPHYRQQVFTEVSYNRDNLMLLSYSPIKIEIVPLTTLSQGMCLMSYQYCYLNRCSFEEFTKKVESENKRVMEDAPDTIRQLAIDEVHRLIPDESVQRVKELAEVNRLLHQN